jgi:hypothetical protein
MKWVVTLTPRPPRFHGSTPRCPLNRWLGGSQSVWTCWRTFRSRISAFMLSWFSVACQGKWRVSTSDGPSRLLPFHHWRSPCHILRLHLLYSWNSVIEWTYYDSCSYFSSKSTRRGSGKANRSVVDGKISRNKDLIRVDCCTSVALRRSGVDPRPVHLA